jgi:prepilin-type N-terminal cleavage/methylation domain-containing protein
MRSCSVPSCGLVGRAGSSAGREGASRRRGLTLVELMIAMAITTVIMTAAVSMLYATSQGTASRQNQMNLVVMRKLLESRFGGLVRSAKMATAVGANSLVLWMYDANNSNTPNRSELRYLEYNSGTGELTCYKTVWPAGWTSAQATAADTEFSLSADFATVMSALKTDANTVAERWTTGVTGVSFKVNNAAIQSGTLVSYTVTVSTGWLAEPMIGAAALHNAAYLSQEQ